MITIKMRQIALGFCAILALSACQGTGALDSVQTVKPITAVPLPPPATSPQPLPAPGRQLANSAVPSGPTAPQPVPAPANVASTVAAAPAPAPIAPTATGPRSAQGARFPNFAIMPQGATSQMSPEEEAALLVEVIGAQEAQPQLSTSEQALYDARIKRLAEIRSRHALDTETAIEAR